MTAFGLGLIILSLCVPYRPEGWPVGAFWADVGLMVFGFITEGM